MDRDEPLHPAAGAHELEGGGTAEAVAEQREVVCVDLGLGHRGAMGRGDAGEPLGAVADHRHP